LKRFQRKQYKDKGKCGARCNIWVYKSVNIQNNTMNYLFLPLLMITMCIGATAQQKTVFHDRDAEVRKVGDFHSIEVSSAIDLQLSQGTENSVAISAPGEENRDNVKTEVRNGVLKIWYENKQWLRGSGRKTRAYVSVKSLKRLTASGACDVTVNGSLNSEELFLTMSGASDFRGNVKTGSLKIQLSGASDVVISGSTGDLKIGASGASHFKGYDLNADNCRIDASGASDIKITVNKVLSAQASGATSIDYKGSGMIGEIQTSGASNIRKRS
jgi:hypothetical protein